MSVLRELYTTILTQYILRPKAAVEFTRPVWLFLNKKSRALYAQHPPTLDAVQQKIVDDVKRDGFSITHVDKLFPDQPELLASMFRELEVPTKTAVQDPKKAHFKILWDSRKFHLDPKSIFVRFALSDRLIDIANEYFGMWTRLLLSNGYIADPVQGTDKINTQNWHRDGHDIQLLSVFLYLTDVNSEGDGALWYVRGSHALGPLGTLFPQRKPHSCRKNPSEAAVDARIPQSERLMCTGRKGTLIICDATGIHRGGHCTENRRIITLTDFASDHRFSRSHRLSYPEDRAPLRTVLSPQGRYAAKLDESVTCMHIL